MASPQPENNPWHSDDDGGGGGGPRFPLGWALWVGLLVAIGATIWILSDLLPGRLSADDDSDLEIVRLVALLALVSSGLLYVRQINVGEVVRNLAIWIGLAAVLVIGYSFRAELTTVYYRVSGELVPGAAISLGDDEVVITAADDGHFYIWGRANGERVRFMVDTGASHLTLSPQDAERIGIDMGDLRFTQRFNTANGVGFGAPYPLYGLSIGSFEFDETRVFVNQAEMGTSLLGMSVLDRLGSFEFRDDKLYLRR